jgi:hypothetical protein
MSDNWLRPEYQGREDELETRADFEKRTGITKESLSSMFTRYADRMPKVAKKVGKMKYFPASELDGFVNWIKENSGTRSDAEVKRAEVARLLNSIEDGEDRVSDREKDLAKAQGDLGRFRRQLKRAQDDLAFYEQVE